MLNQLNSKFQNTNSQNTHEQTAINILSKVRKATYLVQPSGYTSKSSDDFWLHMEFDYSVSKADVVVESWWVTDFQGVEFNLCALSFEQIQFVMNAMNEEFEYHKRLYYDELERDAYQFHPRHERD